MTSIKLLKIHKWWTSHYGTMMAFAYLVVAISPSPPPLATFLKTLGIFTLASLGIGSFGQLLNDLADVSQDVRTGTQNLVAKRGPLARAAMVAAALLIGILPWWWLPTTPAILALLAAEYALFAVYSLPPVRLKNRGILGPVADSVYGYVVPNTVAVLLFANLGGGVPAWVVAVIAAWAFLFGLDKIIEHQLLDESRDRADGVRTFVVTHGWPTAFNTLLKLVLPLEAIAFAALLVSLGWLAPLIPAGFLIHLALQLATWSHGGLWNTTRIDRLPPIDRMHVISNLLIARFTWRWLPLLSLATLVATRPDYLPLAVPHLLLFPEPLIWLCRVGIPEARRLLHAA